MKKLRRQTQSERDRVLMLNPYTKANRAARDELFAAIDYRWGGHDPMEGLRKEAIRASFVEKIASQMNYMVMGDPKQYIRPFKTVPVLVREVREKLISALQKHARNLHPLDKPYVIDIYRRVLKVAALMEYNHTIKQIQDFL